MCLVNFDSIKVILSKTSNLVLKTDPLIQFSPKFSPKLTSPKLTTGDPDNNVLIELIGLAYSNVSGSLIGAIIIA